MYMYIKVYVIKIITNFMFLLAYEATYVCMYICMYIESSIKEYFDPMVL